MAAWRSAVRALLAWTLVLALLGLGAGAVWLTRHPETPWLEDAEEWPLVGSLARSFREAYLPPEPRGNAPARAETDEEDELPQVIHLSEAISGPLPDISSAEEGAVLPRVTKSELEATRQEVWLEPGDRLRARPDTAEPPVLRIPAITNVRVLERRGGWVRVAYRGRSGWVRFPSRSLSAPPVAAATPAPVLPVPALPPDPDRLEAALALLGSGEGGYGRGPDAPPLPSPPRPSRTLGPYALYTDLPAAGGGGAGRAPGGRSGGTDLLPFLDRVASGVDAAYRQRYGRVPIGEPAEAVVLFAERSAYLTFQRGEERLSGLDSTGYAGGGLVALYADRQHPDDVASTLVHEIVHLLNRRALGPALPPWLDEGLAGDLGSAGFTADGRILPGKLGGRREAGEGRIDYHGTRAALRRLREAVDQGRAPALSRLTTLSWEDFVAPPDAELHYAAAALLLRYLQEGENGRLADPLRAFLAAVSRGEPPTGEALLEQLGRGWPEVERGFTAWLRFMDALQEPVSM